MSAIGSVVVISPWILQKFFLKTDYQKLFLASYTMQVIQSFLMVLLALRITAKLGIPDLVMVLLFGYFAEVVERLMDIYPSIIIMGKIIPPGIEGCMISMTFTIINLNF